MTRFALVALGLLGCAAAPPCRADDWPQWLGPRRDAIWREARIVTALPEQGLPVKWRVPVKGGYSGPAVADGRLYLTDYDRRAGELANAPNDRTVLEGSEEVHAAKLGVFLRREPREDEVAGLGEDPD
ncbi:MAG: PQQ-binding-like beta-propeller repeat protein, partial [Planctomycetia bacterium]